LIKLKIIPKAIKEEATVEKAAKNSGNLGY
jgi:hypothetical protein